MFLQLRQIRDTVFQLPFPVLPKLWRNLLAPRPIARRVGLERFFLLNLLREIHHFRNLWGKNLTSLTIVSICSVLPLPPCRYRLTWSRRGCSIKDSGREVLFLWDARASHANRCVRCSPLFRNSFGGLEPPLLVGYTHASDGMPKRFPSIRTFPFIRSR